MNPEGLTRGVEPGILPTGMRWRERGKHMTLKYYAYNKEELPEVPPEVEVFDIYEAAAFLRMSKGSVYKLCRAGKIPHRKILGKYRFERQQLLEWIRS